jgi:hypothetical protein
MSDKEVRISHTAHNLLHRLQTRSGSPILNRDTIQATAIFKTHISFRVLNGFHLHKDSAYTCTRPCATLQL